MTPIELRRRFYADEIAAVSNIANAPVVDALASIPRERFLRPGPWTIKGEADFQSAPRQTPDADPRHVYHNLAIALDPQRMLFNGAPGLVAMVIDRLALEAGERVLHIGTGTGYYTALMAHCVGSTGRVVGVEVDETLASEAQTNLASMPWVEVRSGNGTAELHERFDAILVNAGVTHVLDSWLDALAPGGRLALPLTAALGGGPIGKGPMVLITSGAAGTYAARTIGFVAIYSAVGVRDETFGQGLAAALQKNPLPPLTRLRRDPHSQEPSCWQHRAGACLSVG